MQKLVYEYTVLPREAAMKHLFPVLLLVAQAACLEPLGDASLPLPAPTSLLDRDVGLRPGDGRHLKGGEKLWPLAPLVRCDRDAMTLRLRGRRDSGVLVERAGGPPVPLSQLPRHCGFSLRRSRRDLLLVAPYDGCHVAREDGRYVLPLRVHGAPVKVSCPATPRSPATVSCEDSEMVVRVEGASAHDVRVKVSGSWKPLRSVCGRCLCRIDAHHGHLLIKVPYTSACVHKEAAGPTIGLLTASGETMLSCPSAPDNPAPSTPVRPMFPSHYPVSFYPVFYPPIPSPIYPKYPFYPVDFHNDHPKAPPVNDLGANMPPSTDSVQHIYPFYPLAFPSDYPRVPVGDLDTKEAHEAHSERHIYPSYPFYPLVFPNARPRVPVGELDTKKADSEQNIYPFYPLALPNAHPRVPVGDLDTKKAYSEQNIYPLYPLALPNAHPRVPVGDLDTKKAYSEQNIYPFYPLALPSAHPRVPVGDLDTKKAYSEQNIYPFYPLALPNAHPRVPVGDLDTKKAYSEQNIYPGYPFYPLALPNAHPRVPVGDLGTKEATNVPSDQHVYLSYPFYPVPFNSHPKVPSPGDQDADTPPSTVDSAQYFYPKHPFYHMPLPNNGRVSVDNLDRSETPLAPASNPHPYPRDPFYQMPFLGSDLNVGEWSSFSASTAPSSHPAYGRLPQWYQQPLSVPGSPGKDPVTASAASSSPDPVGSRPSTYPLYPPYFPISSYHGRGPEMTELEPVTPLATPCPVSQ